MCAPGHAVKMKLPMASFKTTRQIPYKNSCHQNSKFTLLTHCQNLSETDSKFVFDFKDRDCIKIKNK